MRIAYLLSKKGIAFEPLLYPPAFTAQKRAVRLRVRGEQILKAILLVGPEGPFLAILQATRRVNLLALGESLGGPVRLATADEIRRTFPDCECGIVPPFGHLYGLPTLLDDAIAHETSIVFVTHTHAQGVRMTCRDFERIEYPRRLKFATLEKGVMDQGATAETGLHPMSSL